ncbi:uncharacterized protein LOC119449497 [Dermacentor silvarum]|uniref:uncharacterized protein LOC119449497 n=1 Tax=Dermacentor silvarum TaxID=543639 RepID=UPI0021008522|nr:uncharacterized protein LOC119449497 [Dermacentor silvarum]
MPSHYAGIQWKNDLCYLGVPLSQYRNSNSHWSGEVGKIQSKVNSWRGRNLSMFSRAEVCNVFLVSRLMYVLQVLHCSRLRIQALHRVFATFIWSSRCESMRRDNLFVPLERGGLGLVHLFVRQIVPRLFFFRDSDHPFLREMLQLRLAHYLPDIVVSSDAKDVTQAPWGFLKEVVDSFLFLKVRFSLEYIFTASRKEISAALVYSIFPDPLYRAPYLNQPYQDVLRRVRKMCIPPGAKTFFFKLHTETLPVKTWLKARGCFVPWSTNCRLCPRAETIDHCFIDCTDAIFFWDILQRTLKKDIDITPYAIRFLPFTISGGPPYDMFVVLGLYSLWRARMCDRHAESPRSTRSFFQESAAYIRSVYAVQEPPPDWMHLLDACVCLPEF